MAPRVCPPGVLCIENVSLFMLVIVVVLIALIYWVYQLSDEAKAANRESTAMTASASASTPASLFGGFGGVGGLFSSPSSLFSSVPGDILLNPYAPPRKENPFFNAPHRNNLEAGIIVPLTTSGDVRGPVAVPINIPTSHLDLSYRQVGILTRNDANDTILPLMGRPLHANRQKWQYYTMSDKNSMIKLPVSVAGRSCTSDIGCDEIFNGDSAYVEGYRDSFAATVYENDTPRYIPYL
jgi:Family of unknown function (DUF5755)